MMGAPPAPRRPLQIVLWVYCASGAVMLKFIHPLVSPTGSRFRILTRVFRVWFLISRRFIFTARCLNLLTGCSSAQQAELPLCNLQFFMLTT